MKGSALATRPGEARLGTPPERIILVEDDPSDVLLIRRALQRGLPGAELHCTLDLDDLARRLHGGACDLLITDHSLPGFSGLDVIDVARREGGSELPILVLTSRGDEQLLVEAFRRDVDDYVCKSAEAIADLAVSARFACAHARIRVDRERSHAETARAANRQRLALDVLGGGFWEMDLEHSLLHPSRAARELLGLPGSGAVTVDAWVQHAHEADRGALRGALEAFASGARRTLRIDHRVAGEAGGCDPAWIRVVGEHAVSRGQPGRARVAAGLLFDVTEQVRHGLALSRSQADLRRLVAHRDQLEEALRRELSREIHDDLGQILSSLQLGIDRVARRAASEAPFLGSEVSSLREATLEAMQRVRGIASALRPAVLDDLGLGDAADWLVRDTAAKAGLECRVRIDPAFALNDPHRQLVVFRVLQEAVTNVVRHARASRLELSATALADGGVELRLRDDGVGFTRRPGAPASGGLGILGMHERAEAIGATLDIASTAGRGTSVTLRVPQREAAR